MFFLFNLGLIDRFVSIYVGSPRNTVTNSRLIGVFVCFLPAGGLTDVKEPPYISTAALPGAAFFFFSSGRRYLPRWAPGSPLQGAMILPALEVSTRGNRHPHMFTNLFRPLLIRSRR